MILTSEQRRYFDDQGYLVINEFFVRGELEPLIAEVNSEIDRLANDLMSSSQLSHAYEEQAFERRLTSITQETDLAYHAITENKLGGKAFFDLLTNPRLLDVASEFCGPELIASGLYWLRAKLPGRAMGCVPWHQDSGYFEPLSDSGPIITVWIPLVEATQESGCLWILPGAHKKDVYKHRPDRDGVFLEIAEEDLPVCKPVCVPMKKGSILLMTNTTPHASFTQNVSDTIRWSLDLRYQNAALPACYPSEPDFLVRSRARPGEVCREYEDFQQRRRQHQLVPMTDRWSLGSDGRQG